PPIPLNAVNAIEETRIPLKIFKTCTSSYQYIIIKKCILPNFFLSNRFICRTVFSTPFII
ncbi:hypothetical protein ACFCVW_30895, partial [Bacillus mobilis]|uniref:hypothetical protein n=1 Tax=Bacillus mobilis TaxID=2026190 RepID=UPI0035E2A2F4